MPNPSHSSHVSYWLAGLIVLTVTGWMASIYVMPPSPEQGIPSQQRTTATQALPQVAVETPRSRVLNRSIDLSGQSEPNRTVILKSEIRARVIGLHKRRGETVKRGDLLVTLDQRDWPDRVRQAKANLHQRQLEQQSVQALRKRGLGNDAQEAQAATTVANARAELKNAELQLAASAIRAPFDGILNDRFVEIGDFLQDGAQVAEILDLDPLVIRAQLPEQQLRHARVGMKAQARFADGHTVEGHIRYVSRAANESTRTFRLELEVANPDQRALASGASAKLMLPLGEQRLHHVSPALLVLDDDGRMGLKAVNDQQQVVFLPTELAGADQTGAWLSGIPANAQIITRGQGYVGLGDTVSIASQSDAKLQNTPVMANEEQ